jgi:hypothetical protein
VKSPTEMTGRDRESRAEALEAGTLRARPRRMT